jgi:glycosyltransferase involved in cell wall biosynthesis
MPLRVLIVHETYQFRGGEDQVVETDARLLVDRGHNVHRWTVDNQELIQQPLLRKAFLLWETTWSHASYRQIRVLAEKLHPDVVHFHNTLPIISPSGLRAAHDACLPVVMTLHNFRLFCPVGTFFRDGHVCEDCVTRSLTQSVIHGCYRGSRLQTAAVATMLAVHRQMGTWSRCVEAYIAPTEFMREKAVWAGLPADRIFVRPHAVTASPNHQDQLGDYLLFVGRLTVEKGIEVLLTAAPGFRSMPIKIVGTGPLTERVRSAAAAPGSRVEYLGPLDHEQTMDLIRRARVLIVPSQWYEGLGLVLIEALGSGVPIVATRLGAMAEIVTDSLDGLLFEPGNAGDLAKCVNRIVDDEGLRSRMSAAASATFDLKFSIESSYEKLMGVYELAIRLASARRNHG